MKENRITQQLEEILAYIWEETVYDKWHLTIYKSAQGSIYNRFSKNHIL